VRWVTTPDDGAAAVALDDLGIDLDRLRSHAHHLALFKADGAGTTGIAGRQHRCADLGDTGGRGDLQDLRHWLADWQADQVGTFGRFQRPEFPHHGAIAQFHLEPGLPRQHVGRGVEIRLFAITAEEAGAGPAVALDHGDGLRHRGVRRLGHGWLGRFLRSPRRRCPEAEKLRPNGGAIVRLQRRFTLLVMEGHRGRGHSGHDHVVEDLAALRLDAGEIHSRRVFAHQGAQLGEFRRIVGGEGKRKAGQCKAEPQGTNHVPKMHGSRVRTIQNLTRTATERKPVILSRGCRLQPRHWTPFWICSLYGNTMRHLTPKALFFLVWKAGLVVGLVVFAFLWIKFPGIEIRELAIKHLFNLCVVSSSLYVVAKMEDKKNAKRKRGE
jgi:hypothetical protein